jgi:RNA polymerase sigma factor (TIGR02999 family)
MRAKLVPTYSAIPTGADELVHASPKGITKLLVRWQGGDAEALNSLIPMVYGELHDLARRHLSREREGHTLQSTALVNEVYMRLLGQGLAVENRTHFFAVSSHLMRQILVDYARKHRAQKRGDGFERVTLSEAEALLPQAKNLDLLALDDALHALERADPQLTKIVELRFFGGLSIEEAAQVLGVSPSTVKREWALARALLHRELKEPRLSPGSEAIRHARSAPGTEREDER